MLQKFIRLVKQQGLRRALKGAIHILAVESYAISERRFDFKFHVDTSTIVRLEQYDIDEEKKKTAVRYQPTPIKPLRSILQALDIDHSRYTFVDIGSGKGRVLLLASEYPYKKIIGVEISNRLHRIAQKNFETWTNSQQKCQDLECICVDAREYQFPEDPLVLFFFTPFTGDVLGRVIDNLNKSLSENPRPVEVIYFGSNEELIDLFRTLDFPSKQICDPIPFLNYRGILFSDASREAYA